MDTSDTTNERTDTVTNSETNYRTKNTIMSNSNNNASTTPCVNNKAAID